MHRLHSLSVVLHTAPSPGVEFNAMPNAKTHGPGEPRPIPKLQSSAKHRPQTPAPWIKQSQNSQGDDDGATQRGSDSRQSDDSSPALVRSLNDLRQPRHGDDRQVRGSTPGRFVEVLNLEPVAPSLDQKQPQNRHEIHRDHQFSKELDHRTLGG